MTRTTFIAKTAKGAPIEAFDSRQRADLWIALEGDKWPGWSLEIITTKTTEIRAVLDSDPAWERAA